MQTIETLVHEHDIIEHGLAILNEVANRVSVNEAVPTDKVQALLDFFQKFADTCHHAKEEGVLFPELEARGIPRNGGPIGVMLYEHDEGRAKRASMVEALPNLEDATARDRFVCAARDFVSLLGAHIHKENNILFKMAENVLSDDDDRRLYQAFERHEREVIGEGEHERLHQFVHDMEHEFLAKSA